MKKVHLLKSPFSFKAPELKDDHEVETFFNSVPYYKPTELKDLTNLAKHLNVAEIAVKDESSRFGINSFKGAGVFMLWLAALLKELVLMQISLHMMN
ncbi:MULTISPECIES: hypothetical protein [Lactobacillus]|jgi:diaminopropionate ammonia-lyase|uniref:hypothetical protein n=1 Tax=Lactobacillus TaxID=1578 RepID=UPI000AB39A0A|nr:MULTISPECIES: hypothetical protein [Lactobacillus]VEF36114.1 diaminopropionate ammonia-lyase [Lactobacillus paragasseri]